MRVDILTLFPEMFSGPFDASILKRARDKGLLEAYLWNIRDFALDRHRIVDDSPYGGGPGMVMKPEPIVRATEHVLAEEAGVPAVERKILLMSPQGRLLTQQICRELSLARHLVLICGHYEGVDERVKTLLKPVEISIGDFVLTGGELPALVIVDAVSRLIPGVLGAPESVASESFSEPMLEYPQYTRPQEFMGEQVPEVLLSGHHEEIRRWRRRESLRRTSILRPDLMESAELSDEDRAFLGTIRASATLE